MKKIAMLRNISLSGKLLKDNSIITVSDVELERLREGVDYILVLENNIKSLEKKDTKEIKEVK
jgi:hypothetical protein